MDSLELRKQLNCWETKEDKVHMTEQQRGTSYLDRVFIRELIITCV